MTNIFKESDDALQKLLCHDPIMTKNFVTEHYLLLKKTIRFSGMPESDYDDLIQDTFSTFFKSLPQFENRSKIKTFLYGIFYNKLREARRKNKHTPIPKEEIFISSSDDDYFNYRGHWLSQVQVDDPQAWEEYSELSRVVEDCLEELPFIHKQVLLLEISSNMNQKEICHSLDINDTNYRQCLSRGKKSLRGCIEDKFRNEIK